MLDGEAPAAGRRERPSPRAGRPMRPTPAQPARSTAAAPARDRQERLVEVAWLHHEYGLTQDAIARRYGVSRSTISRALRDAEELGIVQVTLTVPLPREWRLSERVSVHLGIPVHVGAPPPGEESARGEVVAGRVAARLIERVASGGHVVIAASWGRTLSEAARCVRPRHAEGVVVVDAVGHTSGGRLAPALDVSRTLASALGADAVHLASPAFADPASHAFLATTPAVERTLDLARRADIILTSVGVVGPDSLLVAERLVDPATMDRVVAAGAVGEILGQFYDRLGQPIAVPTLVTVGLTLGDLRAAHRVVAVAAGTRKAEAVRSAAAGGLISEAVIDASMAEALLAGPPAPG